MPDVIEFPSPRTKKSLILDDDIRDLFGHHLTDEEVEAKRNELADFCDVLVDLSWESLCRRP